MVTKKNGKLLFFNVLSVLIVLGFMLGFVTNAEEVTDYKKMPPPEGMGIIKPTTGFKFHIESKDGEVTEQWTRGEFSGSINVKVGDKVTVTDWSGINTTGASLKMWDYQKVLPSGQEIVQEKSASLNGVIDSFTVTQEGHYEFYIAVSDTGGQELGWDNWSQNGSHTAIKVRNGKEYKWYFVRLDMDATKEETPPPTEPGVIYLDAKIVAPSDVDKGETFTITNESTIGGILWSDFIEQNPDWTVDSVRWFYRKPYSEKVKLKSKSFEKIKVSIGNREIDFLMRIHVTPPDNFKGEFKVLHPITENLDDYIELK